MHIQATDQPQIPASETDPVPVPRKIVERPKVVLLRPPQLFYFGVWPRGPRLSLPLGLLAIGSFLERNGVDVQIYDCFVEGDNFVGDQLQGGLTSSVDLVGQWIRHFEDGGVTGTEIQDKKKMLHFGGSWDKLAQDMKQAQPDVVGITNLFRENTEETLEAAGLVREILPDALIVLGGPNAAAQPELMLGRSPAIDLVGLADGEHTMLEIVRWVKGAGQLTDIQDIVYRGQKGYVHTSSRAWLMDLDQLGPLNYDLVKIERYFSYERNGIMSRNKFAYRGAERAVSLVTSRGCPYKCTFCSIHIHAGRKYRRYSVESTLDHIENLVRNHGVRHIHFEDDNLTLDRPRFMRLMNGILARDLKFTWDTPNGVFASTLNEEMLRIMKRTGCTYLIIGVESGDQWVLDNVIMKQPLSLENVQSAFRMAKRVGLDMQAFFIIGFPRETLEQINRTLDFAIKALKDYDVVPHMAMARADPGTALYAEASANGHLVTDVSIGNAGGVHGDMFVRHMIKNDHFTPDSLQAINDAFHRKAIQITALKTMRYLISHPWVAATSAGTFLRSVFGDRGTSLKEKVIKLFFCRLFYRNSLLRVREFERSARSDMSASTKESGAQLDEVLSDVVDRRPRLGAEQ